MGTGVTVQQGADVGQHPVTHTAGSPCCEESLMHPHHAAFMLALGRMRRLEELHTLVATCNLPTVQALQAASCYGSNGRMTVQDMQRHAILHEACPACIDKNTPLPLPGQWQPSQMTPSNAPLLLDQTMYASSKDCKAHSRS